MKPVPKKDIKKIYGPNGRGETALQAGMHAQATLPLPLELALTERIKELHCLQQIEQIIGANQGTLDDILQQTVDAIPKPWLHSANTVARISRGTKVYQTVYLDRCQSVQSSAIRANDTIYGCLEVGYTKPFAEAIEGPFLAEERVLLDTIAARLGSLIARAIAEEELKRSREANQRLYKQLLTVLGGMAELRDPYTAGHQLSVGQLASAIGVELGLPAQQLEGLQLAASVHDIGKIMVPTELLCKPTTLTRHEYDLIKDHAEAGYNILKDVTFPGQLPASSTNTTNEWTAAAIPMGSMAMNCCWNPGSWRSPTWCSPMCAHRPYRARQGNDAALAEITLNRGRLYDAEVVDACLRLFNEKRYVCSC